MQLSPTLKAGLLASTLLLSGCPEVPKTILLSDGFAPVAAECLYPSVNIIQPLPSSFSLLSWNIYKQQGDWQAELNRWIDDSDLLLLQEAQSSDELHDWLQARDYHWFQVAAFTWQEKANGVLTAAAGQASRVCGQRIREPATRIPKSLLFSYYHLEGAEQQLLVVNLHAVNFSLRGRTYQEQLDRISGFIENYGGPVIVAGDFNRWNPRRERLLQSWAEREQLIEAVPTPDHRTRFIGYPLDAVYYRGLELDGAQSMRSQASDHGPLQVSFRVKSSDKP
ncbi:endonuclease/exonuclease/phosphatase family protein [Oceanisphaera arctica]|uniref:endonuclease/exonuclease/phosphatase family protein n=1 Tax=Oceanisphaera arctica TaxID=641510 RepID=UPI0015E43761|nr:endonuclease/exonuclease/phosphatase family protein [Oceanisphaera arctica]GHA27230.1 EEP domain-containing protein [Oceanisphaera arctica]